MDYMAILTKEANVMQKTITPEMPKGRRFVHSAKLGTILVILIFCLTQRSYPLKSGQSVPNIHSALNSQFKSVFAVKRNDLEDFHGTCCSRATELIGFFT